MKTDYGHIYLVGITNLLEFLLRPRLSTLQKHSRVQIEAQRTIAENKLKLAMKSQVNETTANNQC